MINKIPKFKSEAEEAKFWATHDSTRFLKEMKEVSNIRFPRPKHKSLILDLEQPYIEAIKKIAKKKHIPYHNLIERWIKEKTLPEMTASA